MLREYDPSAQTYLLNASIFVEVFFESLPQLLVVIINESLRPEDLSEVCDLVSDAEDQAGSVVSELNGTSFVSRQCKKISKTQWSIFAIFCLAGSVLELVSNMWPLLYWMRKHGSVKKGLCVVMQPIFPEEEKGVLHEAGSLHKIEVEFGDMHVRRFWRRRSSAQRKSDLKVVSKGERHAEAITVEAVKVPPDHKEPSAPVVAGFHQTSTSVDVNEIGIMPNDLPSYPGSAYPGQPVAPQYPAYPSYPNPTYPTPPLV